ncbi:hypothetical protein SALINJAH_260 [Bacillus phage SalinJah]|uniref:Uncharacterized protein n=1 Tax=Bacillus phage SalinJah TaxID=1837830 RepID=A0A173GBX2_9CAUD|nr:hypothetical protein SALINJAH_260 [Bacillus phage SalinJah]ANH50816.1 hypothetical protein SALINJAH_260 [Bacillus phage SalinJah]
MCRLDDLQTAKEVKQGMREICEAFPFVPVSEISNIIRHVRDFESVVKMHIGVIVSNGDYDIAIELLEGLDEMTKLVKGYRFYDSMNPDDVQRNIRRLYNI